LALIEKAPHGCLMPSITRNDLIRQREADYFFDYREQYTACEDLGA